MVYCDLHMHSTASDGVDPPDELPQLAKAAGLAAIALTDHDTTAGLADCAAACKKAGIAFVPGIEFSCQPLREGGTFHLLGYGFDVNHHQLSDLTERQRERRHQRIPRIIEKLNELGVDITFEQVVQSANCQAIGRPHIAHVLIDKGYVKSVKDAFTRYIGSSAPAYVPKAKVPIDKAIDTLHAAGGMAVLAHPAQMQCDDDIQQAQIISRLKDMKLDGLECHHPDHPAPRVNFYKELAERFGLLVTGGSDYHGQTRASGLGSQKVPISLYETLIERLSGA